jgi:protocatechuate 3,4-dioxygenase beta subunit
LWLPDWNDKGRKLAVNGVVYKADGTPSPNVIIYVYHTDQTGVYPTKGDEKGWAKRHGYLRGWMKTNEKGEYKFFTLRPAAYPGRKDPEHIHVTIKEPIKMNTGSMNTF